MLFVCRNHVKEGVSMLRAPHVKRVSGDGCKCSFFSCDAQAEYKLFSPLRMFNRTMLRKLADEKMMY